MNTMLLDRDLWDVCLDSNRNWAVASDPYSIAQDVASAVRTFIGECYYDTTIGVPWFADVYGQFPPLSLFKALVVQAALTVPEVVRAKCLVASYQNRVITGVVEILDLNGVALNVTF